MKKIISLLCTLSIIIVPFTLPINVHAEEVQSNFSDNNLIMVNISQNDIVEI